MDERILLSGIFIAVMIIGLVLGGVIAGLGSQQRFEDGFEQGFWEASDYIGCGITEAFSFEGLTEELVEDCKEENLSELGVEVLEGGRAE